MSKVIECAKNQYKKAIAIEFLILFLCAFFMLLWQWIQIDNSVDSKPYLSIFKLTVDFSLGFLSAFLPFCLFTLIVFFRHYSFSKKLAVLYYAEAIKFVITILLISMAFKVFIVSEFIWFFVGFFLSLVCNNLIPFLLRKN